MSDDLRDRLGELADEANVGLSDAARGRVLEAVRREGPEAVRAGRSQRHLASAAGLLAVAAAIGLAVVMSREAAGPSTATGRAGADLRACQSWAPASSPEHHGVQSLGPRGAVTTTGSARIEATDPCVTNVLLSAGRVDVRADDLGGGVLRVEAGPVHVEVRGTQFSVTRDGPRVGVAVTEGHVVVTGSGDREIHLRAGERWSRGGDAPPDELAIGPAEASAEGATLADGSDGNDGRGGADGTDEGRDEARDEGAAGTSTAGDRATTGGPAAGDDPSSTPREDGAALLGRAEALWRDDDRAAATRLFREVGRRDGAVAEAAWVRLARLQLRAGNARAALTALASHRRRFADGRLGAEALWLEVDAHRRLGDEAAAEAAVTRLRREYPSSPQARAAAPQASEPEVEE